MTNEDGKEDDSGLSTGIGKAATSKCRLVVLPAVSLEWMTSN